MRLRRPCKHNRYEAHEIHFDVWGEFDRCPGGEFLPEDALTGRLVGSEWNNRRLWRLEMSSDVDASAGAEFVLIPADQVGKPG